MGEETETGELRVVHASPNAPNVDVYVDGDAVLENVSFGQVSDYLELPVGNHTVEVTAAGDPDTSVFEQEVPVGSGSYTAVALGEIGEDVGEEFTVDILQDDNTETPDGEARVRAVHASPDAPNVDVTVESGGALFENVSFGESGYVTVPEGNYTVEVRVAQDDNDGDIVDTLDLQAEAGSVYTAFAVGYAAPDDADGDEPFDIVPSVDAQPGENVSDRATVTFENQTSDGGSVVVASTSLPAGGFVTMHDSSLNDGDALGSVVGVSEYLGNGSHEDVTVGLDEPLNETATLIAMPHRDTNGNEEYDFVSSEGSDDGPYTADGGAVVDAGQVTVEQAEPSVTFEDQTLGEDGAVDVSVNDAALEAGSWLVVTYEDNGSLVIAGVSELADSNDVTVSVEDAGGFPGAHTAHVISELSSAEYAPGDTVSEETAGNVLVNAGAEVTEAMDEGTDGDTDGNETDGGMDGGMDGNESMDEGGEGEQQDDGGDQSEGQPGFTSIAALIALVAAALIARSAR